MCEDCEKLKEELAVLKSRWDSPSETYGRALYLAERQFGGPCGSFCMGYDKDMKLILKEFGLEKLDEKRG